MLASMRTTFAATGVLMLLASACGGEGGGLSVEPLRRTDRGRAVAV